MVTTDVGTTKRERLTPRQLLKLWESEGGLCCICGFKIDADKKWMETLKGEKGFIDEHKRALGLAGSNKLANRGIAHIHCAEVKTREEDMPRINKAKDQKQRALGIRSTTAKTIHGPGFAPSDKAAARAAREPKLKAVGLSNIARRFR